MNHKNEEDEEQFPRRAVELIGRIVEQNVINQAATTDAIIANLEAQRNSIAVDFNEVYDILSHIPDYARSVTIDNILARYEWTYRRNIEAGLIQ